MKVKNAFAAVFLLLGLGVGEAQAEGKEAQEGGPKVLQPLQQTPSGEPSAILKPAAEPSPKEYAPGWVIRLFRIQNSLVTIPAASYGSFISGDAPYKLDKHMKVDGLSFMKDKPGYLYEGYFQAKEKGQYTFIADLTLPIVEHVINIYGSGQRAEDATLSCAYTFEIEGNPILQDNTINSEEPEERRINLIGIVDLEPGLYKARQWLACNGSRPYSRNKVFYFHPKGYPLEGKPIVTDDNPVDEVLVSLKVRAPSESLPRQVSAEDFLHKTS